jgi:hypothetical protein
LYRSEVAAMPLNDENDIGIEMETED